MLFIDIEFKEQIINLDFLRVKMGRETWNENFSSGVDIVSDGKDSKYARRLVKDFPLRDVGAKFTQKVRSYLFFNFTWSKYCFEQYLLARKSRARSL